MKFNKVVETHDAEVVDLLEQTKPTPATHPAKGKSKLAQKRANKRKNLHLETRPSDEQDLLITEVNMDPSIGWKADTCKYTKNHPLRGKDCGDQALHLA